MFFTSPLSVGQEFERRKELHRFRHQTGWRLFCRPTKRCFAYDDQSVSSSMQRNGQCFFYDGRYSDDDDEDDSVSVSVYRSSNRPTKFGSQLALESRSCYLDGRRPWCHGVVTVSHRKIKSALFYSDKKISLGRFFFLSSADLVK